MPLKVFVVDDELVIASTLAKILKMEGFDAHFYVSPLEALEAVRSAPPDLLLSDVMMPDMSGVELAIQIMDAAPACKVLLFSGQAATLDLLEIAGRAGHDFTVLEKPIHPTELLARIGEMVSSN